MLGVGRAGNGESSLNIAEIDPATALAASHSLLAATAEAAGLPISPPAGPLPAMHADNQRLRQILTHLLSNAIRYNRPGGSVRVNAARVGDCVQLNVAGTGLGLGLTLSLQLARAMGGDIAVRSEPGAGSRSRLSLPAT